MGRKFLEAEIAIRSHHFCELGWRSAVDMCSEKPVFTGTVLTPVDTGARALLDLLPPIVTPATRTVFWTLRGSRHPIPFSLSTRVIHNRPPLLSSGQFLATDPEARVRVPALPEKE
jgi:hypothetical protein